MKYLNHYSYDAANRRHKFFFMHLLRLLDAFIFFITLGEFEGNFTFELIFSDWWMKDESRPFTD